MDARMQAQSTGHNNCLHKEKVDGKAAGLYMFWQKKLVIMMWPWPPSPLIEAESQFRYTVYSPTIDFEKY